MNSKRLYFGMLGVIGVLAVGLIGGAYEAGLMLEHQAQQWLDNRTRLAVLDQEQAELTTAKRSIAKYKDLAAIAKSVVPQDKDQAQTVREIVNIAAANGITLSSVTFPSSTLGVGAGVSSSKQLSQLIPVKGIAGVYNLQVTVQSDSNRPVVYSRFISFLTALEHNRRTAQVTSITLQPDSKNRSLLSFTLILDEYIKP